jgi:hypothetical protein
MVPAAKYTFVNFVKKPDETLASVIDDPTMSLTALGHKQPLKSLAAQRLVSAKSSHCDPLM